MKTSNPFLYILEEYDFDQATGIITLWVDGKSTTRDIRAFQNYRATALGANPEYNTISDIENLFKWAPTATGAELDSMIKAELREASIAGTYEDPFCDTVVLTAEDMPRKGIPAPSEIDISDLIPGTAAYSAAMDHYYRQQQAA